MRCGACVRGRLELIQLSRLEVFDRISVILQRSTIPVRQRPAPPDKNLAFSQGGFFIGSASAFDPIPRRLVVMISSEMKSCGTSDNMYVLAASSISPQYRSVISGSNA